MKFWVNGSEHEAGDKEQTLLAFLHRLGLMGTKNGCNEGHCGACTVLVDGKARRACITKLSRLQGARVETIEGLAQKGELHPIQRAFIREGAVQCGFCTPGMIMAAKALLDTTPEPSEEEIREAFKNNLCRCTGYASIFRAVNLAARWLKTGVKDPSIDGSKVVGVSVAKLDAFDKVSGKPVYAGDLVRPGMLYGKLVHTGAAHAKIVSIDTKEAEAMPQVAAVLTAKDIPGLNGFGAIIPHQPVLAADVIRYVGDPVAVVYAENEGAAEAAAKRVKVILEPLKGIFSPEAALAEGAQPLHPEGNILHRVRVKKGEVEAGFKQADVVVEGVYTTPMVEHAYLEPESALAEIDGDGKITVWTGSQSSHAFRQEIARSLGYTEDRVRVIFTRTGGGFGGKEEPVVQIHAALGALKTGRPVKMTLSRQESVMKSTKRHAMKIYMKHGATKDGKLVALEARVIADTGPYASLGKPVIFRSAVVAAGPYVVPNCSCESIGVYTNNAIGGAFRGFGSTQVAFAGEIQMDRLAEKLGLDPLEFRLRNALKTGDLTATGQVLEGPVPFRKTLLALKEALAKTELPKSTGQKKIGIGIGAAYKNVGVGDGKPDGAGARVELTPEGFILVKTGATDMGQGSDTTMAQIAAQGGGFPFARVTVISSDTDLVMDAGMTTASRQTYVSGNAVFQASMRLSGKIRFLLGRLWETGPEDIAFDSAGAYWKNKRLEFTEIYNLLSKLKEKHGVSVFFDPPQTYPLTPSADHAPGVPPEQYRLHFAYSFGAQAAVVEVDEVSGEVKVLKVIAAHEVGRAIHPENVRTQIEGCVAMGLGYALLEEFKLDKGQVVTDNLRKLNLPKSTQIPEIETLVIEDVEPGGPFGAKGLGELPVNPTAPAILNAIYNAVGIRFRDIPVTRVKMLEELSKRGKSDD